MSWFVRLLFLALAALPASARGEAHCSFDYVATQGLLASAFKDQTLTENPKTMQSALQALPNLRRVYVSKRGYVALIGWGELPEDYSQYSALQAEKKLIEMAEASKSTVNLSKTYVYKTDARPPISLFGTVDYIYSSKWFRDAAMDVIATSHCMFSVKVSGPRQANDASAWQAFHSEFERIRVLINNHEGAVAYSKSGKFFSLWNNRNIAIAAAVGASAVAIIAFGVRRLYRITPGRAVRRYSLTTLVYKIGGVILLCIGAMAGGLISGMHGGAAGGAIIGGILAIVATLGQRLYNRARKIETSRRADTAVNDTRSPVLYLRSFKDDVRAAQPVAHVAVAGAMIAGIITEEEVLVKALSGIGPVVAVGKPGEELPELGARRIYLRNEQWQERVTELMRESALVVLRPGQTSGVWWEISQAMTHVRPERCLLVLPFDGTQYAAFVQEFKTICGKTLPVYKVDRPLKDGRINAFVYFDPDGSPTFAGVNAKLADGVFGEGRLVLHFSEALRPVFVRCGVGWRPPRTSARPVMFLTVLLLLIFFLGFWR
jgi:hypothetical protein